MKVNQSYDEKFEYLNQQILDCGIAAKSQQAIHSSFYDLVHFFIQNIFWGRILHL